MLAEMLGVRDKEEIVRAMVRDLGWTLASSGPASYSPARLVDTLLARIECTITTRGLRRLHALASHEIPSDSVLLNACDHFIKELKAKIVRETVLVKPVKYYFEFCTVRRSKVSLSTFRESAKPFDKGRQPRSGQYVSYAILDQPIMMLRRLLSIHAKHGLLRPSADNSLCLKIAGDGYRITKEDGIVAIVVCLVGCATPQSLSSLLVVALSDGNEAWEQLHWFKPLINNLLSVTSIKLDNGIEYTLRWHFTGDQKFTAAMLGLAGCSAMYDCSYCQRLRSTPKKNSPSAHVEPSAPRNTEAMVQRALTLNLGTTNKSYNDAVANSLGVVRLPLVCIDLRLVVIDLLHMPMRITEVSLQRCTAHSAYSRQRTYGKEDLADLFWAVLKADRLVHNPTTKTAAGECVARPSLSGKQARELVRALALDERTFNMKYPNLATVRTVLANNGVLGIAVALDRILFGPLEMDGTELRAWTTAMRKSFDTFFATTLSPCTITMHIMYHHLPEQLERFGVAMRNFSQQSVEHLAQLLRRCAAITPPSRDLNISRILHWTALWTLDLDSKCNEIAMSLVNKPAPPASATGAATSAEATEAAEAEGHLAELFGDLPVANANSSAEVADAFPPSIEWSEVAWHNGSGLVNQANWCYMNAVLQCLAYTKPLTIELLRRTHSLFCTRGEGELCSLCMLETCLTQLIAGDDIMEAWLEEMRERFVTTMFEGDQLGRQHDAHEFFLKLTERLDESPMWSVNKAQLVPSSISIARHAFGGTEVSRLKCSQCHVETEQEAQTIGISLSLDSKSVNSLKRALQNYFVEERIESPCESCGARERTKRLAIGDLPSALVICLKRFSNTGHKVTRRITFPETLELAALSAYAHQANRPYSLYGVVSHSGSNEGGHYIAYVKNSADKWLKKNDDKTTEVPTQDVLAQEAYLLFYMARTSDDDGFLELFSDDQVATDDHDNAGDDIEPSKEARATDKPSRKRQQPSNHAGGPPAKRSRTTATSRAPRRTSK